MAQARRPSPDRTAPPIIAGILMVKNESHVILDALRSFEPVADHLVVLDTGSTDGTQDLVRGFAEVLPTTLYEEPFIDFSSSRNNLLDRAEPTCDWMIILDADMAWQDAYLLRREIELAHQDASVDGIALEILDSKIERKTYWQVRAFRAGRGWRYKYRTHELAVLPAGSPVLRYSESTALHFATGGSRANKYERDLTLLALDIADDPTDYISHYYLAGTYEALGRPREAIKEYRRSIKLNPDSESESVYISRLKIAQLLEALSMSDAVIEEALADAAATAPWRFEARALLYRRLVDSRRPQAVIELERVVTEESSPRRAFMFVDPEAEPRMRFEIARALYAAGDAAGYRHARQTLLDDTGLPRDLRDTIRRWPS